MIKGTDKGDRLSGTGRWVDGTHAHAHAHTHTHSHTPFLNLSLLLLLKKDE